MNKSQMRIGLGFVAGLILLAVLAMTLPLLSPDETGKPKAQIISIHSEIKKIADALNKRNAEAGNLTNIDANFILYALFNTNTFLYSYRTNVNGDVLDVLGTPYKIEFAGHTNFIIYSAGRDRKFGDADDIIFNSISNDFVKP
jgi:hypothetical protein